MRACDAICGRIHLKSDVSYDRFLTVWRGMRDGSMGRRSQPGLSRFSYRPSMLDRPETARGWPSMWWTVLHSRLTIFVFLLHHLYLPSSPSYTSQHIQGFFGSLADCFFGSQARDCFLFALRRLAPSCQDAFTVWGDGLDKNKKRICSNNYDQIPF